MGRVEDRSAHYYVVSRIVDQDFLLDSKGKEQFVRVMRMYEAICGVRVLTYCIMSNHFHILGEVPPKCDQQLDNAAVIERLSMIYSKEHVAMVSEQQQNI